jgi:hypothetical protein
VLLAAAVEREARAAGAAAHVDVQVFRATDDASRDHGHAAAGGAGIAAVVAGGGAHIATCADPIVMGRPAWIFPAAAADPSLAGRSVFAVHDRCRERRARVSGSDAVRLSLPRRLRRRRRLVPRDLGAATDVSARYDGGHLAPTYVGGADVNGDGFVDVVLAALNAAGTGRVYVYPSGPRAQLPWKDRPTLR